MDLKEETELTDVSREDMNDIQWLKAKYKLVLEREKELLDFLQKKIGNMDYRIKALEKKIEGL